MKLSIETKFDIGETVYVADFYTIYIPCKQQHIITNFDIHIFKDTPVIVYDTVDQDGLTDRFVERHLFRTYEECTKWCAEMNKSQCSLHLNNTK